MTKRIEIRMSEVLGPVVTIDGKIVRCDLAVTFKREGPPLVVEKLTLKVLP